jgi:hypothetical protein
MYVKVVNICSLHTFLATRAQATLEEVINADLLLHVLDVSSPALGAQRAAVLRVLRELGLGEPRLRCSLVEVLNKADLLDTKGEREMPAVEAEQPGGEPGAGAEAAESAGPGGFAATGGAGDRPPREVVCGISLVGVAEQVEAHAAGCSTDA